MRRDAAVNSNRHCERSEAIQSNARDSGLRRRFAPRNDSFWVALCATLLLIAPAFAEPRTINDCEAIKEADAYNLCLASFGPTRAQKVKSYPGVATQGGAMRSGVAPKAAPRRVPGFGGRAHVSHNHGGRVHMEFTPRAR